MTDNIYQNDIEELDESPETTDPEELNPLAEASDFPELEEQNVINGTSGVTALTEANLPTIQAKKINKTVTFSNEEVLLIGEVLNGINGIVAKSLSNRYLEIGELLIEKIYENDPGLIEGLELPEQSKEVEEKKKEIRARKHELFKQLTRDLRKQSEFNTELPAKTYLNNSIRLVIDNRLLKECEEYQELNISQKIELLPLSSKEEKIKFAKKITEEGLSVRATREEVREALPPIDMDILYQIKNVEKIDNIDNFIGNDLPQLISGITKFQPVKTACDKKLLHTEARIKSIEEELKNYQRDKAYLEKIKNHLEEISPTEVKKKVTRKPSPKH